MNSIVFLSHASGDKEVVDAFVTDLFDEAKMKGSGYQLFYSSHPNIKNGVRAGDQTLGSIESAIKETVCFVAFLSEAYFKSQWCLAELASFSGKKRHHSCACLPILILIDDEAEKSSASGPWTTGKHHNVCDAAGLARIKQELCARQIPLKDDVDISRLRLNINEAFKKRDRAKKGEFFDLARSHFTMPGTSNNPLSFFVERDEYEQTSVNMAEAAKDKLLWTVFQSPLLVAEAYGQDDFLTPYDRKFPEFGARSRIRLVIFSDTREASAYKNLDLEWHAERLKKEGISITKEQLSKRKTSFESSAKEGNATLLFTEMSRLPDCLELPPQQKYTDKSFLEFAYGDYGHKQAKILMDTGFSSPFSRLHRGRTPNDMPHYGHVTFYQAPIEEGATNRISNPPYDKFYGHLTELWQIAKSVFSTNPDPRVFFKSEQIDSLCGTQS